MPVPVAVDPNPAGGLAGPVAPPVPSSDWRAQLLVAMGAPVTAASVQALGLWATSEGVNPHNNNWLAITDPGNRWPHAGVVASNGGNPVYAFPSVEVGVQATAAFLRGSNYTHVVDAFRQNAGLAGIFHAINSSPWCRGCQNNNYPIALSQAVNGGTSGFGLGSVTGIGAGGTADGTDGTVNDSGGTPVDTNPCLIGWGSTDVLPDPVPFGATIPGVCLLRQSQGWAIVGALALTAGALLLVVGAVVAATGQRPPALPRPTFTPRVPMRS